MAVTLCCHCRAAPITRPRQLCWACYYTPGIRRRYPPENTYPLLGLSGRRRLPRYPTLAPPGSAEKIAVLARRAQRGEELWHPEDVTLNLSLPWSRAGCAGKNPRRNPDRTALNRA